MSHQNTNKCLNRGHFNQIIIIAITYKILAIFQQKSRKSYDFPWKSVKY